MSLYVRVDEIQTVKHYGSFRLSVVPALWAVPVASPPFVLVLNYRSPSEIIFTVLFHARRYVVLLHMSSHRDSRN